MWFIMLITATLAMLVYCLVSLFFGLKIALVWKLAGATLVIAASLKWVWFDIFGGSPWTPGLPYPFWLILETAFNSLIALVCLLVLIDFSHFLIWLGLHKIYGPFPFWRLLKLISIFVAIGLGVYGTWEACRIPPLKKITFSQSVPEALKGFKIVQLSDLHIQADTPDEWLLNVVSKTNSLKPDLIVITGDIADGFTKCMQSKVAPLADLKAKYGVFGVSGNHERYWEYGAWLEIFRKLNIEMLEDRLISLNVNGCSLEICGIRDPGHIENYQDLPIKLTKPENGFLIVLIHQPKVALAAKKQADLILSGHTHGGHILPLMPVVAHTNAGMLKGWYDNIYVSSGTGLWRGFSFRIGSRSEITEITLQ